MRFDGALHDGEAETGALGFPGAAIRALEHKRRAFAADAHSIIGDGDDAFVTRPAPGDGEAKSAVLIFFEEVFDQVGEDLVPVEAVAADQAAIEMRQPLITRMRVLRASFTIQMMGANAAQLFSKCALLPTAAVETSRHGQIREHAHALVIDHQNALRCFIQQRAKEAAVILHAQRRGWVRQC